MIDTAAESDPDHSGLSPDRRDGFAPIEDYAALGDGRTVALVARDGRIDWWPVPTMASPPAFAAILDPDHGGYVELRPRDPGFRSTRRYIPNTNVVQTEFVTATGTARITDAMSLGGSGPLPWGEVIRQVDGASGTVEMIWSVVPGTRFGTAAPWTEAHRNAAIVHVGDQHLGIQSFEAGEPRIAPTRVSGSFTTEPGSRAILAITTADAEPLFLPELRDLEHHLDRTVARWTEWTRGLRYGGPWLDAVTRSALALKLLMFSPTGGIAAAATTSLPERIGGEKNWDYRYMWVRDSSFTIDALMALGLHEEVQSAVSFLLDVLSRTAPDLRVFYRLDGDLDTDATETILAAPGYRDSAPVRSGNGAADQTQLGNFGDLFDTMWHYVSHGHRLDDATGQMLAGFADRCCDQWRSPDSGIWELQQIRHYTISKIGCWVALDRAVRLADRGAITTAGRGRWANERDAIQDWVNEHCWSQTKHSYTFYAGSDDLDAATLLAGRTGFARGDRLAGTIAAIRRELCDGPLVYRYSGMQTEEGAFIACTFWLVNALVCAGDLTGAAELMDEAVPLVNDVGLLAEEMDPSSRAMLGNYPQGLSHLALINAATSYHQASSSAGQPETSAVTDDRFQQRTQPA
jgi:GH15 family glucan-1,4-alpha-glucosidase